MFLSAGGVDAALIYMSLSGDMKRATDLDAVWKALADPTRRSILDALAKRALTTGELVDRFPDLCRTGVMKHLDVLVEAELVLIRRQGRVRWNRLNPMPIQRIYERWVSKHMRGMASAMSRLKDQAEGKSRPRRK